MGNTMRVFVGQISLVVAAGAAVLGVAGPLVNGIAADTAGTPSSVSADGVCPTDMHWSVPLGVCITGVAGLAEPGGDMHW